jgi:lipoate-protein ligase A
MAWDEALLEAAAEIGQPVLRFYGWSEPAATFGYFQKFTDVQRMTRLRPLIRRPTGGGLVPHDGDWTYSLIVPPSETWYELSARDSYRRIHEWIREAFAKLAVSTILSPGRQSEARGQCFARAEQFDLLHAGRKIAGAAQRRNRQGLLIQGSIQPSAGIAREDFEDSMKAVAASLWNIKWQILEPGGRLSQRVLDLSTEKYSQPSYNERR